MNIDKDLIGKPPNVAHVINDELTARSQDACKQENGDTREQLEADVYNGFSDVALSEQMRDVLRSRVHVWLDRQAAITERELCGRCSPYATVKDYMDTINTLLGRIDSLNALLTQKQRVIDIQRESFKNLEYEIKVLKKKGAM